LNKNRFKYIYIVTSITSLTART